MLDEKTKEWLEFRNACKETCEFFYCKQCKNYREKIPMWDDGHCTTHRCDCPVIYSYYDDAVTFEMRVAAFMAKNIESCDWCKIQFCQKGKKCADTRMKWARLSVEEELEKEDME